MMGAEDFHMSRALKGTLFRMQTYSSHSTYGASRLTGSWTNCTEAFTDDHMESEGF